MLGLQILYFTDVYLVKVTLLFVKQGVVIDMISRIDFKCNLYTLRIFWLDTLLNYSKCLGKVVI